MSALALRIGLVGAVHPNMPGDDAGLFRTVAEGLTALGGEMGFEVVRFETPLTSPEEGRKAVAFLNESAVDFTLFFNASLPYGRVTLPFADLDSFLGIWAVPEPTTEGVLQLNSFCGLNMIGSILTNYFDREKIKYKWFYGMPDSPMFQERLHVTIGAIRAIKAARESRIGQIGDLADGFENMYIDERELRRRFGTDIQTRHSVEDVVRRAESYAKEEIDTFAVEFMKYGKWNRDRVTGSQIDRVVRVNKALADIASEQGYRALAVNCWSKFQEVYGIAVCGALSRLNESGIVAACEADVTSALSMLMLSAASGKPAALNDMVGLDERDGSINLWHCGVAPRSWADERGVVFDSHFNIGEYKDGKWVGKGVVVDMNFKPGTVTIFNLRNDFDHFFMLSGEVMKDKKGFAGSSGWVNGLTMNGEPVSIPDLINTISVGRVNHHYVSAWGSLEPAMREVAFWKDASIVERRPYSAHMQAFA